MDIYAYQRPLGKIDDVIDMRDEFIDVYDAKDHKQVVRFCVMLSAHLERLTGFQPESEISDGLTAMKDWLDGKVNYHPARNASFEVGRLARGEQDLIKKRYLRTMSQLIATPHVKYHGLWATDYAVTLINALHPGDLNAVRMERSKHIEILSGIK